MLSLTLASVLQKLQMPVVNQTGQLVVALASSLFLWLCQTTTKNKTKQKQRSSQDGSSQNDTVEVILQWINPSFL